MRNHTFEIKYQLGGEPKESSYSVLTSIDALKVLMSGMSRRDRLFFKLIKISMI